MEVYLSRGSKGVKNEYFNVLSGGLLGWDGEGAGNLSALFFRC